MMVHCILLKFALSTDDFSVSTSRYAFVIVEDSATYVQSFHMSITVCTK